MAGMSRRRYLGGLAATSGGLLAAACDLGIELPGVTQSKPAVAIRVLTFPVTEQETIWQEIGARFAEGHPRLTLMQQGFPLPSALVAPHEWINELAASGDLFDVIEFGPLVTAQLAGQDLLLDLTHYIKRDGYDLSDYWPGVVAAVRWQGALLALPTEATPNVLYSNPALFAQVDLVVPAAAWTWEQLLAAARKLTDRAAAEPVFGLALSYPHAYQVVLPWLWSNGGAMLSADLSRSLVAQPEAQAALQWLVDLTLVHEVSPTPPPPPPPAPSGEGPVVRRVEEIVPSGPELFAEGRVAMLYHSWQRPERFTGRYGRALRFTPTVAEPPRGSVEPVSLLQQSGYQIGKATEAPDAAWTFLAWWTGPAAQRWYRTNSSRSTRADPPARRSLATELVDRYGAATVAALGYARHVPLHPRILELLQAYGQGLASIWTGEQAVEAATAGVSRRQNTILEAWRKQQGAP